MRGDVAGRYGHAKQFNRHRQQLRSTKSPERKREQKKRWFSNGQKWRTGCEGRISVTKRRHGLNRCRYKGQDGMRRWVGLSVIADNLLNIGRTIEKRAAK
jgi:transposase, IS5 family